LPDFRWKLKYQSSYEAPTSTGGGEFTLHCKDCEKFYREGNGAVGVCFLPGQRIPKMATDTCHVLYSKKKNCSDCCSCGIDSDCKYQDATGPICSDFSDRHIRNINEALEYLLIHGEYSRERIEAMLGEFENSEIYKFVTEHRHTDEF